MSSVRALLDRLCRGASPSPGGHSARPCHRSWLIISTAVPCSRVSSTISSMTSCCTRQSSAVVGSSAISSAGLEQHHRGQHDALAHAAGELVRIGAQAPFGVAGCRRAAACRGSALARCAALELRVCSCSPSSICRPMRHRRIERGHRLLEHHADAGAAHAAQLRRRRMRRRRPRPRIQIEPPAQLRSAAARKPIDRARRHGLAAAGFADDADDLAAARR